VNYEDRTDLEPSDEVVPRAVLVRLGRSLSSASQALEQTVGEASVPLRAPVQLALEGLVKREIELGAPEGAPEVARVALVRCYSYGRAVLGETSTEKPSRELLAEIDRMYVYGLSKYLCPSDPETFGRMLGRSIAAIVPADHPHRYAIEESAALHWYLGLAMAVADSAGGG